VLFEVGACVALYLTVLFIEWSPSAMEWLGISRARRVVVKLTLLLTIFGVILSTLHQSGLGALYLMAKEKIHPLWYSEFIPILFFVSSIFAGLSMVIFEGSISQKVFFSQISEKNHRAHDGILHGLSRICAFTMLVYFFLQVVVFVHGKNWGLLSSRMGAWYLTEAETKTLQDAATILASLLGGGLLSMYLIGFLTRKGDARAVWAGIVATMLFTAWTILSKNELLPEMLSVPFDLYYTGIIGNVVMFIVVYLMATWFRPNRNIDDMTIWK